MSGVTQVLFAWFIAVALAGPSADGGADAKPQMDRLRQGVHVFPVRGSRVTYSKSHAGYPATDIFSPTGSQFVSPVDGVIDYVSRSDEWKPVANDPATRGGLAVAIIGVDGWRHYGSHLSEVEPGLSAGVVVRAGQLLGRVGTSGNARGKTPHLHFGISVPSAPDDWKARRGQVDPYPYLKIWERSSPNHARSRRSTPKKKLDSSTP